MDYLQPPIDWRGLLVNGTWILGAAVVLAVFGYACYASRSTAHSPDHTRVRDLLDTPAYGIPFYLGLATIFLGLILSADTLLNRVFSVVGLLLCVYVLALNCRDIFRPDGGRPHASGKRGSNGLNISGGHRAEPQPRPCPDSWRPGSPSGAGRLCPFLVMRAPGDVPFYVIAAMAGVSLLVSALPMVSARAIIPLAVGLVLFWGMSRWEWTERRLVWAWFGLIAMGAAIAILGLIGMLAKPSVLSPALQQVLARLQSYWTPLQARLPDTFHPNTVGAALALLLPFALTPLAPGRHTGTRKNVGFRVTAGFASGLMLATLALSQSRGAFMGVACGILVVNAYVYPRLLPVSLAMGMGLATTAGLLIGWGEVADEVLTSDPAFGLAWRMGVWAIAQQMVGDFAFTGVGFGCFGPVGTLLYALNSESAPHAHNLFLQVAIDLGLPGLAAFLSLLGLAIFQAAAARRLYLRSHQRLLVLGTVACLSSLSGMIVHGLTDAASWGNKGAFVMWLVMAFGAALYRYAHQGCPARPDSPNSEH